MISTKNLWIWVIIMFKKRNTVQIKLFNQSIFLHPVVEYEVYHYIPKMKNKKSVGFDGIPVALKKERALIISTPITHIVKFS